MLAPVATRDGVISRAVRTAVEDERRVLADLARAQRNTGISDQAIGRACGLSRWTVGRIVGGRQHAAMSQLAAIGAALGQDVRLRVYPAGDPIRDAGQQRLLGRLRAQLHASIRMITEVGLPIVGDLRAWDAMLRTADWQRPLDAETVIDDVQAVERRLRLKIRDAHVDGVILLVADTHRNRRAIASAPSSFQGFDRNSRRVLSAIRAGRDPGGSSILFL